MKYKKVQDFIKKHQHIVVLQADNPDGDSLASSLALEAILSEMGKTVTMVCSVDMQAHLKHMAGWDRIVKEIPSSFDACIIVDTSTESLFENSRNGMSWIKTKPVLVIDHHTESEGISFAEVEINEPVVSTGELIYKVAKALNWPIPIDACEFIFASIMSDSLGLTTETTSPETFRIVADLVENGVDIPKLESARRNLMSKDPVLLPYKGILLQRVELSLDNQMASVDIPWNEIEKYSPLYNPSMLVIDDMRMTEGVKVAIGFKIYKDNRITAKIRCNYGWPVADKLAKEFGGGGHQYAAGFKITNGTSLEDTKEKVRVILRKLLDNISKSNNN